MSSVSSKFDHSNLSMTVGAHLRVHDKFHDEGLLQNSTVQNFLLYGQLNFDASADEGREDIL